MNGGVHITLFNIPDVWFVWGGPAGPGHISYVNGDAAAFPPSQGSHRLAGRMLLHRPSAAARAAPSAPPRGHKGAPGPRTKHHCNMWEAPETWALVNACKARVENAEFSLVKVRGFFLVFYWGFP